MPKYTAYFTTTASTSLEIEAENAEEAQDIADEFNEFPTICAQCSGWGKERGLELNGDWDQDGAVEAVPE